MKKTKGFSLAELIILMSLILIIVIFGVVLLGFEKAKTRDAIRIAHMTQVQYGFEVLFNEKNSYTEAASGCQTNTLVSRCNLSKYLPSIETIQDPGKYRYLVTRTPDDKDFSVSFTLERGFGGLKKGKHTLSATGIK